MLVSAKIWKSTDFFEFLISLKKVVYFYLKILILFKKFLKSFKSKLAQFDPVKVGDVIYTGKFRNKKTIVKTIGEDENGIPTINNKRILNFKFKF